MGRPCYPDMPHSTGTVKQETVSKSIFERELFKGATPVFEQDDFVKEEVVFEKKKRKK